MDALNGGSYAYRKTDRTAFPKPQSECSYGIVAIISKSATTWSRVDVYPVGNLVEHCQSVHHHG